MTRTLAYASPNRRPLLRFSHVMALAMIAAGSLLTGGLAVFAIALVVLEGPIEWYGWILAAWLSLASVIWGFAFFVLIRRNSRSVVRLAQSQLVLSIPFCGYVLLRALEDPQPDEGLYRFMTAVICVAGAAAAVWLIWRLQSFAATPTSGEGPGCLGSEASD